MNNLNKYFAIVLVAGLLFLTSCSQPGGEDAGSEFMPDMGHSIAYEANYYDYYYFNTWGSEEDYHAMAQPRKPVQGTIPRGYAGVYYANSPKAQLAVMDHLDGKTSINAIKVPKNGAVPYYYVDTEEDRTRASEEIINNPFPITDDGLERGKELYNIMCGICHGEKGDGNGYLARDAEQGGKYPAAPANFLNEEFSAASNGRYYHAIIYGKNVMGGYPDKLSYEERWQVIHWIRALQAKDKKLVYNEQLNTLNNIEIPGASIEPLAEVAPAEDHDDEMHEGEGDHSHDDDHGGGH